MHFLAHEAILIRCEYRFESFNARGDDDYLDQVARQLDELFQADWTVPEVNRDPAFRGWWQICLFREGSTGSEGARLLP